MVLIRLPKDMRVELKEPMGPIDSDVDQSIVNGGLVTVGDVVSYHFIDEGVIPDVAVVDGKTKREKAREEVVDKWKEIEDSIEVSNPAGTITEELFLALKEAMSRDNPVRIEVEGEEDLATLPAIALVDRGDTVVYGQPGEGMVYVYVDEDARNNSVDLLLRMDIEDEGRLRQLLGLE